MAVITLDVHVDDLDSVLALFDRIQVWRSATELGTYAEITSPTDDPAILDGTISGPWSIVGETLTIVLNSADPINITFTGTTPLNLATVIQQINTVIPGLAGEVPTNTNKVRLTSPVIGTGSAITVSGNAALLLGLPTQKVNGKQARIPLVTPTTEYLFKDYDGDATFWYKTRYFSTSTLSVSSFSDPRQGNPQVVLPPNALVKGHLSLADTAGRPVVHRRVIFVPITPMSNVASSGYGVLPGFDRVVTTTDEKGYAEMQLVIGMQMKVFIEGSSFQRFFTVPSADFDILQVATQQPDPLSVVQAPPMPIRVS